MGFELEPFLSQPILSQHLGLLDHGTLKSAVFQGTLKSAVYQECVDESN